MVARKSGKSNKRFASNSVSRPRRTLAQRSYSGHVSLRRSVEAILGSRRSARDRSKFEYEVRWSFPCDRYGTFWEPFATVRRAPAFAKYVALLQSECGGGVAEEEEVGEEAAEPERVEEYEVKSIVGSRCNGDRLEFEVHWTDYSGSTWEPLAHVCDTAAYADFVADVAREVAPASRATPPAASASAAASVSPPAKRPHPSGWPRALNPRSPTRPAAPPPYEPSVGDRVRFAWKENEIYDGVVDEIVDELGGGSTTVRRYAVRLSGLDDARGNPFRTWTRRADRFSPLRAAGERAAGEESRPIELESDGGSTDGGSSDDDEVESDVLLSWERVELRCAVSFQRLADPAKLSACRHRSACNYEALADYRSHLSSKECPVLGCGAKVARRHGLQRDLRLRALLQGVPSSVETVWIRGDELSVERPAVLSPRPGPKCAGAGREGPATRERSRRKKAPVVVVIE